MNNSYTGWRKTAYRACSIETYSDETIKALKMLNAFHNKNVIKASNYREDPTWRNRFDDNDQRCIVDESRIEVHQYDFVGNECGEVITTLRDPGCENAEEMMTSLADYIDAKSRIYNQRFICEFTKMPEQQNKYAFCFVCMGEDYENGDKYRVREVKDILNFLSMVITVLKIKLNKRTKSLKFIKTTETAKYIRDGLQRIVMKTMKDEFNISIDKLNALHEFIKLLPLKLKESSSKVKKFKEEFGAETYAELRGTPESDPFKLSTSSIIQTEYFNNLKEAVENDREVPELVYL